MRADLTVDADVDALIETVKAHPKVVASGLFGLVHNASFYSQGDFTEISLETYRSLNRLHMEAPYHLTQCLLADLERGKARWSPSLTPHGVGLGRASPITLRARRVFGSSCSTWPVNLRGVFV